MWAGDREPIVHETVLSSLLFFVMFAATDYDRPVVIEGSSTHGNDSVGLQLSDGLALCCSISLQRPFASGGI